MGKKDKSKKGKGIAKTEAKTNKKLEKIAKKNEQCSGEKSIEEILSDFKREQEKKTAVTIKECGPPSPRSHFSFTGLPLTNELMLYGGEYFDGKKMLTFADLIIFNCDNKKWMDISSPNSPSPRSGHQAVYVNLTEIPASVWIFGGEFASASQSRFHHYKDLWAFGVKNRKWELISQDGPCPRSGHRMVQWKKSLLMFGGFSDTGSKTNYFSDLWQFDLIERQWTKMGLVGEIPPPRSACLLFPGYDSKHVYITGGYSKLYLPKDEEKGVAHADFYQLTAGDKNSAESKQFKSVEQRLCGAKPLPWRTSMSGVMAAANKALVFGGVHDVDTGDSLQGFFSNDLLYLELDKAKFHHVQYGALSSTCDNESGAKKRRKNKVEGKEEPDEDNNDAEEVKNIETMSVNVENEKSTSVDGIFSLTINDTSTAAIGASASTGNKPLETEKTIQLPSARSSAGLALINNVLYVYGGIYEVGDRRITLDDLHSLDLNLNKSSVLAGSWQVLYNGTASSQAWYGSDMEDSDSEEDLKTKIKRRKDKAEPSASDSEDEEIDIDAPVPRANEAFSDYWIRTKSVWCDIVRQEDSDSEDEGDVVPDDEEVASIGRQLAKSFYQEHMNTAVP